MKNLEKVFIALAFLCAFGSFVIAVYEHASWIWQFATMTWVSIAFLKTVTIIEKR